MNSFLASVERRALAVARLGLRDPDDALDVVQDAMLKLAEKYGERPAEEWPPLFFRILNNRITDLQRRRTVRQRLFGWFDGAAASEDDLGDPLERVPGPASSGPEQRSRLDAAIGRLEAALQALPPRQREAFLLRQWEGLDVAATARAMGVGEGSVKTHYFRAVHQLRDALEDDWP